jgi:hypothetical protein
MLAIDWSQSVTFGVLAAIRIGLTVAGLYLVFWVARRVAEVEGLTWWFGVRALVFVALAATMLYGMPTWPACESRDDVVLGVCESYASLWPMRSPTARAGDAIAGILLCVTVVWCGARAGLERRDTLAMRHRLPASV